MLALRLSDGMQAVCALSRSPREGECTSIVKLHLNNGNNVATRKPESDVKQHRCLCLFPPQDVAGVAGVVGSDRCAVL